MTAVFFQLFIYPLSKLSFKLLFRLSDFLYFINFYVVGYRKKVVETQLKKSFVGKTNEELSVIVKGFYKNFSDTLVECLKLFSVSKSEILDRVIIKNPELLNRFHVENRSVIALMGHYCNWEMMCVGMPPQFDHKGSVIYSQLKNEFVDKAVLKYRSKFGMHMFSKKEIKSWIKFCTSEPVVTFFVSDQFPKKSNKIHHTHFLNQETEVALGAEIYARKYNWPVVYLKASKVERGKIEITFELISSDPRDEVAGMVTEKYCNLLESQIKEYPEYWLWSHKRWKKRN